MSPRYTVRVVVPVDVDAESEAAAQRTAEETVGALLASVAPVDDPVECPVCGGEVVRLPGPGRPPKYCSPGCSTAAQTRRLAERRAAGDPVVARSRRPTGNRDPVKKKRALELLAAGFQFGEVATRVGLSVKTVSAIAQDGAARQQAAARARRLAELERQAGHVG